MIWKSSIRISLVVFLICVISARVFILHSASSCPESASSLQQITFPHRSLRCLALPQSSLRISYHCAFHIHLRELRPWILDAQIRGAGEFPRSSQKKCRRAPAHPGGRLIDEIVCSTSSVAHSLSRCPICTPRITSRYRPLVYRLLVGDDTPTSPITTSDRNLAFPALPASRIQIFIIIHTLHIW